MIPLSAEHTLMLRLQSQHLAPQQAEVLSDAAQVVRAICGVQAQVLDAARLAIRARSTGLTAAAVERARVEERTLIRTWGPRGTLHLLATKDLGWLLPLFGPVFIAANRRRREELGLDEETCARAIHALRETLAHSVALTRAEIVECLAARGIQLRGQARPHLLMRAALEGVICLGPDRGSEPTYVLLGDWVKLSDPLPEEEAYIKLACRYLSAYAPAGPEDLAAWSGLPMNRIRTVWQRISDQLIEVAIDGQPAWMLETSATRLNPPPSPELSVRLLPSFDTYLLGYKKRELALSPQYAKRINAGGGIVHATLLVNGRVAGTWQSKRQKSSLHIQVEPFEPLARAVYPLLEAEAADLARFLELPTTLEVRSPA